MELVGLDVNADVVETVRRIADELGYDEARFEATAIASYPSDEPVDLLVSLHACDTATDDAIAAGVRLKAKAIVVAPVLPSRARGADAARPPDALLATACCSAGRPT